MEKQQTIVQLAKRRKEMQQALLILESISNRLDYLQDRIVMWKKPSTTPHGLPERRN